MPYQGLGVEVTVATCLTRGWESDPWRAWRHGLFGGLVVIYFVWPFTLSLLTSVGLSSVTSILYKL